VAAVASRLHIQSHFVTVNVLSRTEDLSLQVELSSDLPRPVAHHF